jgi:hypothetical protein
MAAAWRTRMAAARRRTRGGGGGVVVVRARTWRDRCIFSSARLLVNEQQ